MRFQVTWDGPDFLRTRHAIKHVYPQCERLFVSVLNVTNADYQTAHCETRGGLYLYQSSSLKEIHELLQFVQEEAFVKAAHTIEDRRNEWEMTAMFPLWKASEGKVVASFDGLHAVQSTSGKTPWFIADREHLKDAFLGKVPLFACEPEMVQDFWPTITALRLERLLLSNCTTQAPVSVGSIEAVDSDLQQSYRGRAGLIMRRVQRSTFLFLKRQNTGRSTIGIIRKE